MSNTESNALVWEKEEKTNEEIEALNLEELIEDNAFLTIFEKIFLWEKEKKSKEEIKEELYYNNQDFLLNFRNKIYFKIFFPFQIIKYLRNSEYRDALFQLIRISQKIDEAKK